MRKINLIIASFLFCLLPFLASAQIDGEVIKPRSGKFLLTNATIVTVTNGTMENASLLIENGKIQGIGTGLSASDAEEIDCTGHYIYPGMFDSGTKLGMVEINSVQETVDHTELGSVTPNMQALTTINPNAVAIPVTRVSGVTTTLAVPGGGIFSGTAALINLNGYTPDQMYAGFKGIVMNYPSSARRSTWDRRSDEDIKKDAEKALKNINEVWQRATMYSEINAAEGDLEYYPEMEHLAKAVTGELPLLIEVNAANDILEALKWLEDKEDVNVILTGVAEGWRVADKIAEAGYPVITGPMLSIPTRGSDRFDVSYTNPGKMLKAGVKVAIRTNDTENVRNLPFNAGFAAAYGMGKEEALKAVTIVPAEIFGVEDNLGSIEEGKSATLFVSDGDPFETKTQIKHVFIEGYRVPMSNRHIQLYQEFLERDPGLEKHSK
ncbi:amidohydrolase family protein [Litoribacter ruber]|uniref:amidohydrolase family protein n=1 Tax=Litoribacter ruber TaxID=702568 RepID=UPI001BD9ABC8|nr:amidohydrolase family protein [Litoribacter ruber]MBT0810212.1 amidohydrolase family protein [Litoribacter ruber]